MASFVQPVDQNSQYTADTQNITVNLLYGEQIRPYIRELARLCLDVYREWPYLYEGSEAECIEYVEERYVKKPDSVVCIALEGKTLIGAVMGLPLCHAPQHYLACYNEKDQEGVFYWGELAVYPKYRNLKIAKEMYTTMGKAVIASGKYKAMAFCEVIRSAEFKYPMPGNYVGHGTLWNALGFEKKENLTCQGKWKLVGEQEESSQLMVYWWKQL